MNIKELSIPCVKLITPEIHHDSRGYFLETFNLNKLESCLNSRSYVQDNETYSEYGVLRGIHFQSPPYAQSKLMRVIQGEVFDVIVDPSLFFSYFYLNFSFFIGSSSGFINFMWVKIFVTF